MNTLRTRWKALVLTFLLALSLAVPAAAAEPETADTETTAADLQTLADTAASYAAQYGGAQSLQYALWQDGEIVLTGQAGDFSRSENRLMTGDELYGIGSVSKIYTTVAIMQLVEDGKVSLDAPVTRYLKDFKMADPRYKDITVRMLLNHSSGLLGTGLSDAMLFGEASTKAHDTLLEKLSTQRLAADPGAFSVYCNDGFSLAELVVEAVSGQSFMDYVDENILAPLDLDRTFAPGGDFDTDDLARIYRGTDPRALPQDTLNAIGAGGIYATASDLASFGGALTGTELLRQSSLDAMAYPEYSRGLWPDSGEPDSLAYGLGGATPAAACLLALGIGIQNLPEGTAVSVPLRREGMSRGRAFFFGQLSGIVEPISGVLGALLVLKVRLLLPYMLAFAAGAMIYVVVEELIPESQTNERKDVMALFTLIGFSVMMVLDVALG